MLAIAVHIILVDEKIILSIKEVATRLINMVHISPDYWFALEHAFTEYLQYAKLSFNQFCVTADGPYLLTGFAIGPVLHFVSYFNFTATLLLYILVRFTLAFWRT